jgi:NADH-quinone oxidoreductase subunit L
MFESAYLIVLAPLAAAVMILFLGRKLPLHGALIGVAATLYGFIHALALLVSIYQNPGVLPSRGLSGRFFENSITWFQAGAFRMELGTLIDGLSAMMLVVVTFVALLVFIYSIGYQHGKPYLNRYYATLSLFTFAMLLLVAANNMLQFFVGWELVGLCSFLLIGFEFEREAAASAGRKAFLTTKVGDLGFYIGLLLLFTKTGTFNIPALNAEHVLKGDPSHFVCAAAALLFFCGAVGKSAQVPLHVWLPDAMEGPTPVSALMHAATMVAAGVYMVARIYFLFAVSHGVLAVVAWTGAVTAFFTATMALVNTDIKRVLAFSTISQLGYMMLALGSGSVSAAMFHLTTHACFKALLFLGAGSVIHAVHTNDIWKMGGLSKKMPITFACFAIATLAISGLPPFAGFFSKDRILEAVYETNPFLFGLAVVTAGMTAFYMFRLTLVTFLGRARESERAAHAHESGASMAVPLVCLAIPSVAAGFLFKYVWPFEHWIPGRHGTAAAGTPLAIPVLSLAAVGIGAVLAWQMYIGGRPDPAALARRFGGLHKLLTNRYYIDEFYLALIDRLIMRPARAVSLFDYHVIDQGIVDGAAAAAFQISRAKNWFDSRIVDGCFVNGTGAVVSWTSRGLRMFQNGFAQFYLLVVVSGVGALILWALRSLQSQ